MAGKVQSVFRQNMPTTDDVIRVVPWNSIIGEQLMANVPCLGQILRNMGTEFPAGHVQALLEMHRNGFSQGFEVAELIAAAQEVERQALAQSQVNASSKSPVVESGRPEVDIPVDQNMETTVVEQDSAVHSSAATWVQPQTAQASPEQLQLQLNQQQLHQQHLLQQQAPVQQVPQQYPQQQVQPISLEDIMKGITDIGRSQEGMEESQKNWKQGQRLIQAHQQQHTV